MTTLHTLVGAALAAVCVLPLTQDKAKPATAPGEGTVVGAVDFTRAIRQSPKWLKFREEFEAKVAAATKIRDEQAQQIDELQASIKQIAPGSRERLDAEFHHDTLVRQREAMWKWNQQQLELDDTRALVEGFRDLEAVVEKVAKKRGVQLVLRRDTVDCPKDVSTLPPRQLMEIANRYDRREVGYASPDVDLTNDVIKELMVPVPDAANGTGSAAPAPDAPKSGG